MKSKQTTLYAIYHTESERFVYFDSGEIKTDVIVRRSSKFKTAKAAQDKFDKVVTELDPKNCSWIKAISNSEIYPKSEVTQIKRHRRARIKDLKSDQYVVVKVVTKITVV